VEYPTFPKLLTSPDWSSAVNNFVAISNQWKSWCTAKSLFQQKFPKQL